MPPSLRALGSSLNADHRWTIKGCALRRRHYQTSKVCALDAPDCPKALGLDTLRTPKSPLPRVPAGTLRSRVGLSLFCRPFTVHIELCNRRAPSMGSMCNLPGCAFALAPPTFPTTEYQTPPTFRVATLLRDPSGRCHRQGNDRSRSIPSLSQNPWEWTGTLGR